jgi:transcription initiation factor TFIIIB Brf1 subunit/transcription initiation factor TFIIB
MIKPRCKSCGSNEPSYDESHDAYYCKDCDAWIEGTCEDHECQYCRNRHTKPSELYVSKDT